MNHFPLYWWIVTTGEMITAVVRSWFRVAWSRKAFFRSHFPLLVTNSCEGSWRETHTQDSLRWPFAQEHVHWHPAPLTAPSLGPPLSADALSVQEQQAQRLAQRCTRNTKLAEPFPRFLARLIRDQEKGPQASIPIGGWGAQSVGR